MRKMQFGTAAASALLLIMPAGMAAAQEGWRLEAAPYLWMSDTGLSSDTRLGRLDAELSFSDALEDLDFSYMGVLEARNGRWGLSGDLIYLKLTSGGELPGVVFSSVSAETEMTIFTGVASYRIHEDAKVAVDLGAGFRAFWGDVDVSLNGDRGTVSTGGRNNWVDPIVAARARFAFDEHWFGTLTADVGGTDDTENWQALAMVGYQINDSWSVQGGWRYLKTTWETDLGENSIDLSGPILGVRHRF